MSLDNLTHLRRLPGPHEMFQQREQANFACDILIRINVNLGVVAEVTPVPRIRELHVSREHDRNATNEEVVKDDSPIRGQAARGYAELRLVFQGYEIAYLRPLGEPQGNVLAGRDARLCAVLDQPRAQPLAIWPLHPTDEHCQQRALRICDPTRPSRLVALLMPMDVRGLWDRVRVGVGDAVALPVQAQGKLLRRKLGVVDWTIRCARVELPLPVRTYDERMRYAHNAFQQALRLLPPFAVVREVVHFA
mmetsp:Transcript_30127/g.82793  ORF Transcript_30127/g.82793 Transcript_30127/m.82793 type:complete len:249 (-) Transcript_30127:628-1374(-)|eukprot:CAMPEP_0117545108 /NCGR_PEP_ID=MMETSP0784-20121206/45924_1 /TAXON_ID=39447 /ORGANISM="" /LENGTH=248 /DNA_ID=CAMNT_0005341943 /DNA_START=173 /DNA_END=919 /DNA_ORIENTATION=-